MDKKIHHPFLKMQSYLVGKLVVYLIGSVFHVIQKLRAITCDYA